MAQAIAALNNLIREGKVTTMVEPDTKKYRLIRALLGMKHSPAGQKYLAKEKKKSTYKTPATTRIESSLRAAGLTEKEIARLRGKGR